MNKNTLIIISALLVIVAAGGGFFAGMQYQKSQLRTFANGRNGNFSGGNFAVRFGGQNFTPIRGQVLSIGNNSITVKEQDGTSKIAVVSSNTTFVQTQKASITDLKTGDTIMVVGTSNSDGSVTAQNIQINPQQFRPMPTGTK